MNAYRWVLSLTLRPVLRLITAFLVLLPILGFSTPLGLLPGAALQPGTDDAQAVNYCAGLAAPVGRIVDVDSVAELESAVNNAISGDTIRVADGTYALNGVYLRMDTPNVTLRSASGNREAAVLDGNYQTEEIVQIVASNVTVADLTLREAYYHPIHVMSGSSSHTLNTLIYNVHIIDPGEQAIKINPAATGYYTDNGEIACSHIELTYVGRPHIRNDCYTGGIDAHQSQNWTIRDNRIEGFWCSNGLSEHAIHLWNTSRDPIIERNILRDNARGIGLGMSTSGTGRTYPDNPCPGASGYVDHFGGIVRNNFIAANEASLFASEYGFDCGICLWNACSARLLHNTVYTANPANTFSSIEWRFLNTTAEITNNLVNHPMRERDGATGILSGNLTNALAAWFGSPATGNLHLTSAASSAIDKVTAASGVTTDIDGDPRPQGAASDVGADEYRVLTRRISLPIVRRR